MYCLQGFSGTVQFDHTNETLHIIGMNIIFIVFCVVNTRYHLLYSTNRQYG
jgi:hypothetical protein